MNPVALDRQSVVPLYYQILESGRSGAFRAGDFRAPWRKPHDRAPGAEIAL